mmetsp:Transcript_78708/g.153927  ORF Transcript_78708/g.153927 Transcript_78708/m.153927 type:complete len:361 (+) Transcript_78708:92-1174(+)
MLLAKHVMQEHSIPIMLIEIHAPVVRLSALPLPSPPSTTSDNGNTVNSGSSELPSSPRSDVSGWCWSQLLSPWLLGSFMVNVYAHEQGKGDQLKDDLQLALRCVCEHRYRNAQIEYAADAAGIEVDPVTRTDDQGSDVNSSTSGEGAATVLTTSATAPKTTMQTTIPKHALHPLTCGSVNHLLEDKEDKDDGEAIDDDDRDGDNGSGNITSKKSRRAKVSELIPSTATATWTSKPTFQLGHSDFHGQQHTSVIQFEDLHPSELEAVIASLREVVTSLAVVLQCVLDAHGRFAREMDDKSGVDDGNGDHAFALLCSEGGDGEGSGGAGVGSAAERAYGVAVARYSSAMQAAMEDATYSLLL